MARRPDLRRFCRALHKATAGASRWSPIAKLAAELELGEDAAIVLAADCAAAGLVRLDVKGPPYRQLPGNACLLEPGRALASNSARASGRFRAATSNRRCR